MNISPSDQYEGQVGVAPSSRKDNSKSTGSEKKSRKTKISVVDLATLKTQRLTVVGSLGSGSSAEVYSATQRHRMFATKSSFALKVVPSHKQKEFAQERAVLTKLQHPHIPRLLFSASLANSSFLLALELGRGGNLLSLGEKEAPLPEPQAALILFQVMSAVVHAHQNGVAHRDIKLENIVFLDAARRSVLLIDWGISAFFSTSSFLTEDCGSLHYAAPALLRCRPYVGPEVDAWALGVLMYTMLTGSFPYLGDTPNAKLMAFSSRLNFPSHLSPAAVHLI